jgi:hypothetical protein
MMTDIDPESPTILVTGTDGRTRHAITNKIDEAGEDYLIVIFADNEKAPRQMGALAYLDIAVIDTSTVGAPHRTNLPQQIHTRWPKAGIIVTSVNSKTEPDDLPEGARFIFEPHRGDILLSHIKELLSQQRAGLT